MAWFSGFGSPKKAPSSPAAAGMPPGVAAHTGMSVADYHDVASKSKPPSSSDYVAIDEEANLPVAIAVAVPDEGDFPPAMNPAYQQQQQQQQQASGARVPVYASTAEGATLMPPGNATASFPISSPANAGSQQQQQQRFVLLFLKRRPTLLVQCPMCHAANVRTRVRTYPNWVSWGSAVALFFLCWPISWIPLVTDCTKQTDHYCTACQQQVGSIQPYQDCCARHRGGSGGRRSGCFNWGGRR